MHFQSIQQTRKKQIASHILHTVWQQNMIHAAKDWHYVCMSRSSGQGQGHRSKRRDIRA